MILVADASALIALASCDGLDWLDAMYGEVLVPELVFKEVAFADKPQAKRLHAYLQGKVKSVDMSDFVFLDAYQAAEIPPHGKPRFRSCIDNGGIASNRHKCAAQTPLPRACF